MLSTIKDIYDTVPTDRLQECLHELGVVMIQARGMDKAFCVAAEAVNRGERPEEAFEWPETITWVDGKKEIDVSYSIPGDKPFMKTRTVLE